MTHSTDSYMRFRPKWVNQGVSRRSLTAVNVDADQKYTFSGKTGSLSFCHNRIWIFNCTASFPQWKRPIEGMNYNSKWYSHNKCSFKEPNDLRQCYVAVVRQPLGMDYGQVVPKTTRTQDNSYPRQLVPKTTRTQDNSYPGQLVPRTTRTQDDSYPGQLVPYHFAIHYKRR